MKPLLAPVINHQSANFAGRILLVALAALAGVSLLHGQGQKNPLADNPEAIAAGKAILEQACTHCHGSGGSGGRGPAINTGTFKRAADDGQLFDIIKNGIGGTGMPSMGLKDDETWQVVAYLRSLGKGQEEVVKGDVAAGEKVFFEQAKCSNCHSVNGRGSRLAPDLSTVGNWKAADLRRAILKPGTREGYHSPLVEVKTKDGRTVRGLTRNEDTFSIQLMDFKEEFHLFNKLKEVAEIKYSEKSPMPANYGQRLSVKEQDDLIAYLKTLKQPDAAKLSALQITGGLSYDRIANAAKEPHNWLTYWGDYSGRHFSALNQINRNNVGGLQMQWLHQPGGKGGIQATPLVVDGIMYTTGAGGYAYALDAASGREIWSYKYQAKDPKHENYGQPNRGFALLGGRLFVTTGDAHVVALDAKTGAEVWTAKLAEARDGYFSTMAPLAVKDKIIVGMGGGELGTRGFLDAYDPATGKRLWRFNTIPGPGEFGHESWAGDSWKRGGGTTWMTGTYDPQLDTLYWGIGNPSPDLNGDVRKGDNLFSCSVVALNPNTGERRWHFQFTPHDMFDWDANEVPMLVDRVWEGKPRKLLMQANRNAFFYVLDRETGQFLKGYPFARQTWAKGLDAKGRPILEPGKEPSKEGTLVYPNLAGATNWQAPSYDPATGWFIFTYTEMGNVYVKEEQEYKVGESYWGGKFFPPAGERTWGGIKALDPETGKIMWDYRFAQPAGFAGCLATAGGVVFSASAEGNLMGFDSKTGKLLWRFQTGADIHNSPMTYSVKGRQYVAVAVGGVLVSFALPELGEAAGSVGN